MKVFFDTNVYVAEALLGDAAERMLEATLNASWRIFTSSHVLGEIERVMVERLGSSRRFALLTQRDGAPAGGPEAFEWPAVFFGGSGRGKRGEEAGR